MTSHPLIGSIKGPRPLPADDAYLSVRALAAYSGLSMRTLRARLIDPAHPVPHYRVGGKILVKRSEFDTWMRTFRTSEHNHRR